LAIHPVKSGFFSFEQRYGRRKKKLRHTFLKRRDAGRFLFLAPHPHKNYKKNLKFRKKLSQFVPSYFLYCN